VEFRVKHLVNKYDDRNGPERKAWIRCKLIQFLPESPGRLKKVGHIDPHAFGSEGTQKLHAGGDKSHSPFQIGVLRMVDGNAYLQNAFLEVPYFPLLIHPDFFQRFMTVVVITPIELPDAFKEL
jgi:hypothetical protein